MKLDYTPTIKWILFLVVLCVLFIFGSKVFAQESLISTIGKVLGISEDIQVKELSVFDIKTFSEVKKGEKYSALEIKRSERQRDIDYLLALVSTSTNEKIIIK